MDQYYPYEHLHSRIAAGAVLLILGFGLLFVWKTCAKYMMIPIGGMSAALLATSFCFIIGISQYSSSLVKDLFDGDLRQKLEFMKTGYLYAALGAAGVAAGIVSLWVRGVGQAIVGMSLGAVFGGSAVSVFKVSNGYVYAAIMLGTIFAWTVVTASFDNHVYLVCSHLLAAIVVFAGVDSFVKLKFTKFIASGIAFAQVEIENYLSIGLFFGFSVILATLTLAIHYKFFTSVQDTKLQYSQ